MSDKALKILAVDDTEMNISLLERFLRKKGHEIIVAVNGQEAVEKFVSEQPDLVLMDVMMPVMDGYDATREIRKVSGDKWVPIIFMSAKVAVEDQIAGLDAGGDDYLTKPINMRILGAKINAMQRIADMGDALATQAKELAQYHAAAEEEKYPELKSLEDMEANQENQVKGKTEPGKSKPASAEKKPASAEKAK